jgi:hypothetical protein
MNKLIEDVTNRLEDLHYTIPQAVPVAQADPIFIKAQKELINNSINIDEELNQDDEDDNDEEYYPVK